MHTLERLAQAAGGTGRYFSQYEKRMEIAAGQTGFQPEDLGGNCQALCLKWLRNKASGKSLLNKLSVNNMDVLVHKWRRIEVLQANPLPVLSRPSVSSYMTRKGFQFVLSDDPDVKLALEVGTMTPELGAVTKFTGSRDQLCDYIRNPIGGRTTVYKFITYTPTGKIGEIGHACAAVLDDENVEFFDPNLGEYTLDRGEIFRLWWSAYVLFANLGTKYNSYRVDEFARDG